MSIEKWIDKICALWEISDGVGGTVRSYRVYEKAEFPEAITDVPVALTYTQGANLQIAAGGGKTFHFGTTEFHITQNVDKSRYPEIQLYLARIRVVMAANQGLGGLVDHFIPQPNRTPQVLIPATLQYGSEDQHLGIVVYWEVKEDEQDIVKA